MCNAFIFNAMGLWALETRKCSDLTENLHLKLCTHNPARHLHNALRPSGLDPPEQKFEHQAYVKIKCAFLKEIRKSNYKSLYRSFLSQKRSKAESALNLRNKFGNAVLKEYYKKQNEGEILKLAECYKNQGKTRGEGQKYSSDEEQCLTSRWLLYFCGWYLGQGIAQLTLSSSQWNGQQAKRFFLG